MNVQSSPYTVFYPDGAVPFPPLWEVETRTWSDPWVDAMLASLPNQGGWVVDPFARHPAFVSRALAAGCRPVAANLDATHLLALWLLLSPPKSRLLDSAFSALADSRRDDTTFSKHLMELYRTYCRSCQTPASADCYIWDGENDIPVEVSYRCGRCDTHGTASTTQADLELLTTIEAKGARYWQLMRRLIPPNDELSSRAEGLVSIYTPRNRQVLLELVLRIESLFEDQTTQRVLKGLVLSCLERCHSLQVDANVSHPFRPTRLRPPRRFVEWNVWHLFETAYRALRNRPPSPWQVEHHLLSTEWQEEDNHAVIRQIPARSLIHALPSGGVDLIVTEVPRPDNTDYALSFLWSGWLWGRGATQSLRPLVTRRGLDWSWYSHALTATFQTLRPSLHHQSRVILSFTTQHEDMFPAVLLATEQADLALSEAVACNVSEQTCHRLVFTTRDRPPSHQVPAEVASKRKRQIAQDAAVLTLRARGQPTRSATLARAILQQWSQESVLALPVDPNPDDLALEALDLLGGLESLIPVGPQAPDEAATDLQERASGWWLTQTDGTASPLSDRVEREMLTLLPTEAVWQEESLWAALYERFPGFLTPDTALLETCLRSYAVPVDGGWRSRPEDSVQSRIKEQEGLIGTLISLGRGLGFEIVLVNDDDSVWWPCRVLWLEGETPIHGFALQPTACLEPWLRPPTHLLATLSRLVLIPASRAILIAHKLLHIPGWATKFNEGGWQFVKNRHIRRMADVSDLDRGGFAARLNLDPIVEQAGEQLPLFI